jgi:hypothetical protein
MAKGRPHISAAASQTLHCSYNVNVAIVECYIRTRTFRHSKAMLVSIDADD